MRLRLCNFMKTQSNIYQTSSTKRLTYTPRQPVGAAAKAHSTNRVHIDIPSASRIAAPFLFTSSYSFSGTESYTIPPLVCVYTYDPSIKTERRAREKVQSPLNPKCPTPPP